MELSRVSGESGRHFPPLLTLSGNFLSRKVATSDNLLTFERFCAGLKICLLRNHDLRSDKESNNVSRLFLYFLQTGNNFPLQDSPSEAEDSRVSKLRKQRFVSAQSPTLTQPPPIGGGGNDGGGSGGLGGGPPKPPRTSYTLGDNRKLGDGGAASDGEIERVAAANNNLSRKQPKRRESHSRRHTLQNGIDYGLVSQEWLRKTKKNDLITYVDFGFKQAVWCRM